MPVTSNVFPYLTGASLANQGTEDKNINIKVSKLSTNIELYLEDLFEDERVAVVRENGDLVDKNVVVVRLTLRSAEIKLNHDDIEKMADEFLAKKYLSEAHRAKLGLKETHYRSIFDIMLQEAMHTNDRFTDALLDVIELKFKQMQLDAHKYKKSERLLPFRNITLSDKSLEIMVKTVNADLNNRTAFDRVFKCLLLGKDQCLALFDMTYKHNCERLMVYVFENCLRYQERWKIREIVRRYFKELVDKQWLIVIKCLLDNCRIANESEFSGDDEMENETDKLSDGKTTVLDKLRKLIMVI
jgi:hypothetical protein